MPLMQPDFRLVVDRPLSERPRQNKWILLAWVVLISLGILNMVHKVSICALAGAASLRVQCLLAGMAHHGTPRDGFRGVIFVRCSSARLFDTACCCCPAGYAPTSERGDRRSLA